MKHSYLSLPAALLVAGLGMGTASAQEVSPKQMFETHCAACHTLGLPTSQRLDLNNWRWVIDDMVNNYGARWITPEMQETIAQYLAETYGPNTPR